MSYWQVHKPTSIHSPSMHFCFKGLKRSLITAGERPIVLPHPFPGLTCQEGSYAALGAERKSHTFLQSTLSVAALGMWTFSSCNLAYILWEDLERTYTDLDLVMLGSYECRMEGYSGLTSSLVLCSDLFFPLPWYLFISDCFTSLPPLLHFFFILLLPCQSNLRLFNLV